MLPASCWSQQPVSPALQGPALHMGPATRGAAGARLGSPPLAPLCLAETSMAGSFWSLPLPQGVASGSAVQPRTLLCGACCVGLRLVQVPAPALRCPRTFLPQRNHVGKPRVDSPASRACFPNQGHPKAIRKAGPCSPFPHLSAQPGHTAKLSAHVWPAATAAPGNRPLQWLWPGQHQPPAPHPPSRPCPESGH